MKKEKIKCAFTLAEILIVLVIIGILSVLMLVAIANNTDKNKGLFKKAYSTTERTVVELVNDETYYPFDHEKFGFKENTDVMIVGADYCTSTYKFIENVLVTDCDTNRQETGILLKFCNLFANNINLVQKPRFDEEIIKNNVRDFRYCYFKSNDGVDWTIGRVSTRNAPVNGFLVKVDVDGNDKGINTPEISGNVKVKADREAPNRDRFYMFVRYDGKIQLPDEDDIAKNYLKSHNLSKEN